MMEKETPLISDKLLKLLVCPVSGGKLEIKINKNSANKTTNLVCKNSGLSYPIKDGVPVLVPKLAEKTEI